MPRLRLPARRPDLGHLPRVRRTRPCRYAVGMTRTTLPAALAVLITLLVTPPGALAQDPAWPPAFVGRRGLRQRERPHRGPRPPPCLGLRHAQGRVRRGRLGAEVIDAIDLGVGAFDTGSTSAGGPSSRPHRRARPPRGARRPAGRRRRPRGHDQLRAGDRARRGASGGNPEGRLGPGARVGQRVAGTTRDKALPTHDALSDAVPDHPVWIARVDGHAALANRAAMDAADISPETKSPDGGEVLRNADGIAHRRLRRQRRVARRARDPRRRPGRPRVDDPRRAGRLPRARGSRACTTWACTRGPRRSTAT
jgi:hypothetical protein